MARKILILLLAFFAFTASLHAQSAEEVKFREKQADALNKYASSASKAGFPQVARRIWLMLLSEYAPNDAEARAALGYLHVGNSWTLDPDFTYPKSDNPDAKAAKRLQDEWLGVADKVAKAHLKMAQDYEQAGRADMARWHFEKVIFFTPNDAAAKAALLYKPVAGLSGTDLEQTLYDRSKMLEKIVGEEVKKDYPVEERPATETNALLEKAKVHYSTVKSEFFTIRGDFEVDLLKAAAINAERALRVMRVAYEGETGFNLDPKRWPTDWAYFKDKETYVQILNANADLMKPADLKFLVEQSGGCNISGGGVSVGLSAAGNEQGILDGAVRSVAQYSSNFSSPALREGIGHAFVAMFFNNNRKFIIDRQEQMRSHTGEEDYDKYSPNMDTWRDLALESAWKISEGTPAARLPMITADKFPDDARIKSWSFCDYLVRRDPDLLKSLDKLNGEASPIDVEKKFAEANNGLSIAQLEKEWKDFWTEASPVLKAIKDNAEPLTAVSPDAKKWLEAFNKARLAQGATPVTWSANYSTRCHEHIEYLKANEVERGAAAEQKEDPALTGGSHLGDLFAQMALVSTDTSKPKELFATWMNYPGYRDAMLNDRLLTIGLYAEGPFLVVDAIRGVGRP
ncbi:MAG: CAP domain-containing protein, partial [Planctomycetota bacterium]